MRIRTFRMRRFGAVTFLPAIFTALVVYSLSPNLAFAQKQGRADVAAQPAAGAANEETSRLKQRVEQLEEQLVDLQVTIGTLESLLRKGGGGARLRANQQGPVAGNGGNGGFSSAGNNSGFGGSGGDDGRLQVMETQIGALAKQVEQLTLRLAGGQGGGASVAGGAGWQNGAHARAGSNHGAGSNFPSGRAGQAGLPGPGAHGFGNVTVTPGGPVQPQSFEPRPLNNSGVGQTQPSAPQNANFDNRSPRQIYDQAYKHLLVQDYGAAEVAFKTFLQNHPNDTLSGNAQYWLGESFYVRGQYKSAAGAFLKGYTVYAKSVKAPDSLLKLAMSLKRLGQKQAACETFSELGTHFPKAPAHIKQRARSERRRSRC